jgi:multisubunit Na+/H+ antiporter MnhB subunit
MRSMVMSILWLFVATAIAISSYPFDPRQVLSGVILVFFILLGAVIFSVYAQMHRDPTLSHVTNSKGLGIEFWFKILGVGIAPLLGLLTTVFPEIADFVFSWLQPGLQSIK